MPKSCCPGTNTDVIICETIEDYNKCVDKKKKKHCKKCITINPYRGYDHTWVVFYFHFVFYYYYYGNTPYCEDILKWYRKYQFFHHVFRVVGLPIISYIRPFEQQTILISKHFDSIYALRSKENIEITSDLNITGVKWGRFVKSYNSIISSRRKGLDIKMKRHDFPKVKVMPLHLQLISTIFNTLYSKNSNIALDINTIESFEYTKLRKCRFLQTTLISDSNLQLFLNLYTKHELYKENKIQNYSLLINTKARNIYIYNTLIQNSFQNIRGSIFQYFYKQNEITAHVTSETEINKYIGTFIEYYYRINFALKSLITYFSTQEKDIENKTLHVRKKISPITLKLQFKNKEQKEITAHSYNGRGLVRWLYTINLSNSLKTLEIEIYNAQTYSFEFELYSEIKSYNEIYNQLFSRIYISKLREKKDISAHVLEVDNIRQFINAQNKIANINWNTSIFCSNSQYHILSQNIETYNLQRNVLFLLLDNSILQTSKKQAKVIAQEYQYKILFRIFGIVRLILWKKDKRRIYAEMYQHTFINKVLNTNNLQYSVFFEDIKNEILQYAKNKIEIGCYVFQHSVEEKAIITEEILQYSNLYESLDNKTLQFSLTKAIFETEILAVTKLFLEFKSLMYHRGITIKRIIENSVMDETELSKQIEAYNKIQRKKEEELDINISQYTILELNVANIVLQIGMHLADVKSDLLQSSHKKITIDAMVLQSSTVEILTPGTAIVYSKYKEEMNIEMLQHTILQNPIELLLIQHQFIQYRVYGYMLQHTNLPYDLDIYALQYTKLKYYIDTKVQQESKYNLLFYVNMLQYSIYAKEIEIDVLQFWRIQKWFDIKVSQWSSHIRRIYIEMWQYWIQQLVLYSSNLQWNKYSKTMQKERNALPYSTY